MNTNCEVISAFIDDEPVDTEALANALGTVEGRRFLIDAIALRGLARSDSSPAIVVKSKSPVGRRLLVAAAVILAAMVSFQFGQRQALNETLRAPQPTRVIPAAPAWQEDSTGGIR
jgi:hypothetical protein